MFAYTGIYSLYGEDFTPLQQGRLFAVWVISLFIAMLSMFFGAGMFSAYLIHCHFTLLGFAVECVFLRDSEPRNRLWLLLLVVNSLAGMSGFIKVAIFYIQTKYALVLSLGLPAVASAMNLLLQWGTERLVYNPRHVDKDVDEDDCARGDQNLTLSVTITISYLWMEAIRFGALVYESLADDDLYVLLVALFSTLTVETLSRLLLPHWWGCWATEGRESSWAQSLQWLLLPTPLVEYLNEVKGTASFVRVPAILFLWACRSIVIWELDTNDGMKTILVVSTLVFIEENIEDTLVFVLGPRLRNLHTISTRSSTSSSTDTVNHASFRRRLWMHSPHLLPRVLAPDWTQISFYRELRCIHSSNPCQDSSTCLHHPTKNKIHQPCYHPQQIVNNPCMKYRQLPILPLIGIATVVFVFQILILFSVVGQRWVFGCPTPMNADDASMFMWPVGAPCQLSTYHDLWELLHLS